MANSLGYGPGMGPCTDKVPQVLYIAPTFGGAYTVVLVKGINLNDTGNIECHFGGDAVNGTVTSATEVQCEAPDIDNNGTSVNLVLYYNGQLLPSPVLTFTFLGNGYIG